MVLRPYGMLLALSGGVLLGVGFVLPFLWPLALVGLLPLIYLAQDRSRSVFRTLLLGWLAGFALYGLALYGVFWHTLPLDWLGIGESNIQVTFVALTWALTSLGMGLAVGVWALAVRALYRDTWFDVLLIPSLWVLAEVLGAFIMYVQNHGPGSVIGNVHFTLGFIGNQLAAEAVLLQTAWVGGVHALSAIAAGAAAVLFRLYAARNNRERRILSVALLGIVGVWGAAHLFWSPSTTSTEASPTAQFAVLTTNLSGPYIPEKNLAVQTELLVHARGADVVVLPEASELLLKLEQFKLSPPSGAEFYIDSLELHEEGIPRSRVEYYDPATGEIQYTYKHFLLPMGEFVPYLYSFVVHVFGLRDTQSYQNLIQNRSHVAGPVPTPVVTPSGAVVGVLFCNEVLSPTLYRSLTRDGAHVLVNIASHLWFNKSRVVYTQIQNAAKIRAVENRRWFLQASNGAPAFVLNEYGVLVAETPWSNLNSVTLLEVPLRNTRTPYTQLGIWVLLLPVLVVLAALALRYRKPE